MNKNFKRVISTVAALAMASSSFVAMAATYPDVTADANYYSAIEQLSALGIMEGFDDGTFKPDEKVTRAQMAKLVVGAKNMLASAESNTTVMFEDVAPGKSDWAIGYVATAASEGIINGTSATTFDPDATVTYAQATKMLVNACGYDAYAQQVGGWPSGYLNYGYTLGINAGVTGVGNDTELTRGQVAQMVANALKAPLLDVSGWKTDNGVMVPEYVQYDGETGDGHGSFKSLLTEKWDVYEVYGRVTATSRDGSAEAGEVTYSVEKTENYDDVEYPNTSATSETVTNVSVGKTNAENLYLNYSYALIQLNSDDEATLLYIESAGKNQEITFNYEDLFAGLTATTIDIYKSENSNSSTTYKLAVDDASTTNVNEAAKLLVNGVEISDATAASFVTDCQTYMSGDVTLVDTPKNGVTSTDGYYDYIVTDYYEVAIVSDVSEKTDGTVRINFEDSSVGKPYLSVDPEDDTVTYSFVDTNGAEVDPATLTENDILSIAYNVKGGAAANFDSSEFYNVVVSRDIVEGQATGYYQDDTVDYWTVNGTDYKANAGMNFASTDIKPGTSYTLYLDKDGNIVKKTILAASVNYAIVDRYFNSAGDDKVRLVLKDGSKVDYVVKKNGDTTGLKAIMGENKAPLIKTDGTLYTADVVDTAINGTPEVTTTKRFVEYTVNSSDEVTLKPASYIETAANATFKAVTGRIGSYGVAESSILLDASQFAKDTSNSVAVSSMDYLLDEMTYTAIFAGERNNSDGTYPMVVVLKGNDGYTVNSRMVVAAANVSQVQVDSVNKNQITIASDSEAGTTTLITEDTTVGAGITEGTAFIYSLNSDGEVDSIKTIYAPPATYTAADKATLLSQAATATVIGTETNKGIVSVATDDDGNAITFNGENSGSVKFYVLPVLKKYSSSIAFADITADTTTTPGSTLYTSNDTGTIVSYAADAKAYMYEGLRRNNKVSVIVPSGVVQSSISKSGMNGTTINDWASSAHVVTYAVVREYDGDIQEVYSISFE